MYVFHRVCVCVCLSSLMGLSIYLSTQQYPDLSLYLAAYIATRRLPYLPIALLPCYRYATLPGDHASISATSRSLHGQLTSRQQVRPLLSKPGAVWSRSTRQRCIGKVSQEGENPGI